MPHREPGCPERHVRQDRVNVPLVWVLAARADECPSSRWARLLDPSLPCTIYPMVSPSRLASALVAALALSAAAAVRRPTLSGPTPLRQRVGFDPRSPPQGVPRRRTGSGVTRLASRATTRRCTRLLEPEPLGRGPAAACRPPSPEPADSEAVAVQPIRPRCHLRPLRQRTLYCTIRGALIRVKAGCPTSGYSSSGDSAGRVGVVRYLVSRHSSPARRALQRFGQRRSNSRGLPT